MRDLFIVGAGGFGREAVWTVERINNAAQQPLWKVIGFADDDPAKATGNFEGYPLLGSVEKASKDHPGASVFVAVGDNEIRAKIYRQLRGHDFPAFIDPSAQVSPTTDFRHGTFIAPEAVVSVGTEIGKFVIINARAGVGHDSKVGDFANIAPGVSLSGHTEIGEYAFEHCIRIERIVFGNGLRRIGYRAFYWCQRVKEVVIGSSLTKVEGLALYFEMYPVLEAVYYYGTAEDWDKIDFEIYWGIHATVVQAPRYYYSAEKPETEGSWWHYDEEGNPVVWQLAE